VYVLICDVFHFFFCFFVTINDHLIVVQDPNGIWPLATRCTQPEPVGDRRAVTQFFALLATKAKTNVKAKKTGSVFVMHSASAVPVLIWETHALCGQWRRIVRNVIKKMVYFVFPRSNNAVSLYSTPETEVVVVVAMAMTAAAAAAAAAAAMPTTTVR
jgi:hypothetical protein